MTRSTKNPKHLKNHRPAMNAMWGTFVIGELSRSHPGYREILLHDPVRARNATPVMLVLEKFVLENGLLQGDDVDMWILDWDEEKRNRACQIDMFAKNTKENTNVRQEEAEKGPTR